MDAPFYGMDVHDDERPVFPPPQVSQPVFPDFLHRQGHPSVPVSQAFAGIPTSGFFPGNPLPRFTSPWSPDPMSLRPDNTHRPINFSLNQRPETTSMSLGADHNRDSVIFTSSGESTPSSTHLTLQQAQLPVPPAPTTPQQQAPSQPQAPPSQPTQQPSQQQLTQQEQNQQIKQLLDHKCPKPKGNNPKPFKCGACYMAFESICKLHRHLRCHGGNGSYFYDNLILTAFPRFRNSINPTYRKHNPEINNTINAALATAISGQSKKGGDMGQSKDHVDFVENLLDSSLGNSDDNKAGDEKEDDSDNEQNGDVSENNVVVKKEKEQDEDEDDYGSKKRKHKRKGKKKKGKKTVCVQCPQCSLEFPTKKKGSKSESTSKKNKEHEPKRVTCDICHKKINSKNALKHIKTCLGMPAYACPQAGCGKKFTRKYTLLLHQRTHIIGTPFTCNICGLGFATPDRHAKHMYMHTENRPWKCDRCPQAFKTNQHLQRHIRTHTKELPFLCHCGKAFAQDGNLKAHMRMHTGEKPYSCEICGKSFAHNVSRKKHMKAHLGMPFGPGDPGIVPMPRPLLPDVGSMMQPQQHGALQPPPM